MLTECVAEKIVQAATRRLGTRPNLATTTQTLFDNAFHNIYGASKIITLRRATKEYCVKGACDGCPGHRAAVRAREIVRGSLNIPSGSISRK